MARSSASGDAGGKATRRPATGVETSRIHVDKGYRGHIHPNKFRVWITGQVRRVTRPIRREMKRCAEVEPAIGHLKAEHRIIPYLEHTRAEETSDEPEAIPFLKRFTVFNTDQCEDLPPDLAPPSAPVAENLILPRAEVLIRATGADIRIGATAPFMFRAPITSRCRRLHLSPNQ